LGVITNVAMIGFSYEALPKVLVERGDLGDDASSYYIRFIVLCIVIGLEHLILFIKFLISTLIPDIPGDVRKGIALSEYLKEETFRLIGKKPVPVWDVSVDEEKEEIDMGKAEEEAATLKALVD